MSAAESNYRAWLAKAENNFLNITNNLAADRVPWDTVCFHAQQAAEKLLKAVLAYHGQTPARTHDLIALLAACLEFHEGFVGLEDDCRRLTVYAISSRYPDDLFEPDKQDALAMVAASIRVRERVFDCLKVQGG